MAKATITGADLVRAIHGESQQTRRGVTAGMAATLVNAGSQVERQRVERMLAALRDEGALRYAEGRFWATEQGLAGADRPSESQTPACTGCDSRPGQFHNPECPAVNAFQAGRISETRERADGADPVEACEQATDHDDPDLQDGEPVPTQPLDLDALVERSAVMCAALLAQARQAPESPERLTELAWLQETGRMLLDAGGANHD